MTRVFENNIYKRDVFLRRGGLENGPWDSDGCCRSSALLIYLLFEAGALDLRSSSLILLLEATRGSGSSNALRAPRGEGKREKFNDGVLYSSFIGSSDSSFGVVSSISSSYKHHIVRNPSTMYLLREAPDCLAEIDSSLSEVRSGECSLVLVQCL